LEKFGPVVVTLRLEAKSSKSKLGENKGDLESLSPDQKQFRVLFRYKDVMKMFFSFSFYFNDYADFAFPT